MARFGIGIQHRRLGVSVPQMRRIARSVGPDHRLALGLWKAGVPEARMLAAIIDEPAKLTDDQMERCVADFDSWDVCDQVCGSLFQQSPAVWKKFCSGRGGRRNTSNGPRSCSLPAWRVAIRRWMMLVSFAC